MKKIFLVISIMFSLAASAQNGYVPLAQNDTVDIKGKSLSFDNNHALLMSILTDRLLVNKPIILGAYATGSFPSIANALAFNSDSLIAGQHQALWYSDAAATWHALPIGSGGGGGGSGTVTSIATNNGITGGTITTTGTIGLASIAAHTYLGNNTASSAVPVGITNTQLTADLNAFTSSLQGLVPASGGGSTNVLHADGSWSAPSCASCFTNGGNGFGGATSFGTTDAQNVTVLAHNVIVGTFYQTDGHFALGNGSGGDPTQLFWVPGTARIDGTITCNANGGVSVTGSSNFSMLFSNSAPSGNGVLLGMNNPYNSGSIKHVNVKGDVSYTSGTNTAAQIDIDPTYNTSGAGAYTMRGVYYHPTYTSTTGFVQEIAWENTKGDLLFNSTAGKAAFGTSINSAGAVTFPAGTSTVAPMIVTHGTLLGTIQADAVENDGTHFYVSPGAVRYQVDQQLAAGNVVSGSYTPTLSNVTNVSSSSAQVSYYQRIGNIVTCYGNVSVTPTVASTATTLTLTIPFSSSFTSTAGWGTAVGQSPVLNGSLSAVPSSALMQLNYISSGTSAQSLFYSFSYVVQ